MFINDGLRRHSAHNSFYESSVTAYIKAAVSVALQSNYNFLLLNIHGKQWVLYTIWDHFLH